VTVYDRYRADPEWAGFVPAMEAHRDRLLGECGLTLAELAVDYPFVRLADLISLAFCAEWTDDNRYGPWVVRGAGARVIVTPDAFGGEAIPFKVTAREIPRRRFTSDTDVREAVARAPVVTLGGTVGYL